MTVPKYVGVYFPAGIRTSKETAMNRLKSLRKSEWGWYFSEYKDLARYERVLREQAFSKAKYHHQKKREKRRK